MEDGGDKENQKKERKKHFYLHGTATELFVQLSAEDRRGPNFVLAGIHALPGDPFIIIASLHTTQQTSEGLQENYSKHRKQEAATAMVRRKGRANTLHPERPSRAEALTTCR